MLEDIIDQHILPFFPVTGREKERLRNDLIRFCFHHQVFARQVLETPGDFYHGRMWFAISSMVHSYYFSSDRNDYWGRQIWTKQEFILDTTSLFSSEPRGDYIQALEAGEFVSIGYHQLCILMDEHPLIREKVEHLGRLQQRYYQNHNRLLVKPGIDRVRQFEMENFLFARIASNTVKASHVGMTRQAYERHLKRFAKGL
jgi:hypothetical protein